MEHEKREQEFSQRTAAQEVEQGVTEKLNKHKEGMTKMVDGVKQENAKAGADEYAQAAAEQKNAKREQQQSQLVQAVVESTKALQEDVRAMVKAVAAPKRIVRGKDGRAEGIESQT